MGETDSSDGKCTGVARKYTWQQAVGMLSQQVGKSQSSDEDLDDVDLGGGRKKRTRKRKVKKRKSRKKRRKRRKSMRKSRRKSRRKKNRKRTRRKKKSPNKI